MEILQTKATIQEGQKWEFEKSRQQMQTTFKQARIETREDILELIKDVKKELLEERYKD